MIKLKTLFFCLFTLILMLNGCTFGYDNSEVSSAEVIATPSENSDETSAEEVYMPINYTYIKAMWLSQYDMQNVYAESGRQRDKKTFTEMAETIISNIADSGYNTVVIQVRPFADSFYPSDFYPPSSFVTGSYDKNFSYDPLEILVDLAHKKNLSVHAWINPLRGMTDAQIKLVNAKYTIRKWYNDRDKNGTYIVKSGSGASERWYLNPCYDEVRALISDGAAEIVKKYDVDGVHMDDYFYPTKDESFDSQAYTAYKNSGGKLGLDDYRREQVSIMVRQIYSKVKAENKNVLFGISPAGIFNTTYYDLYADVVSWCKTKGYIDYIVPQIYFGLEHQNYDFIKVYKTWQDLEKHKDLHFCFGVSLGKAFSGVDNYAGTGKYEWSESKDILKRCLEFVEGQNDSDGMFMFCYQYYFDPATGEAVDNTKEERENLIPVFARLGD